MILMGCRYIFLEQLLAAYGKIQVPLVGFDGIKFIPFLNYDDVAIYILVPKLVQFFNITLDQAINFFFYTQVYSSFLLGLLGFFLLYRSLKNCFYTSTAFLLFLRFARNSVADVYLASLVPALAIIPLQLYFFKKKDYSSLFYIFMIFSGMVISFSHYVRSYSSLGVFGFILCMLLIDPCNTIKKKSFLFMSLLVGMSFPSFYFITTINQYALYAKEHFKEYNNEQMRHPLWHPIYLGFSFLGYNNPDKIQWDDSFAYKKVKELEPTVSIEQTESYEKILKNEIFRIMRHESDFFILTIFGKIGILLWYLLYFANIGLLAFFVVNAWRLSFSFMCALALNSLHAILVLPTYAYSLGYITVAFLFGVTFINEFIKVIDIKNLIRKLPYRIFNKQAQA